MHTIHAPYKSTRLLAQFTLHTYTSDGVVNINMQQSRLHMQPQLLHTCTNSPVIDANPNAALHIITFAAANATGQHEHVLTARKINSKGICCILGKAENLNCRDTIKMTKR